MTEPVDSTENAEAHRFEYESFEWMTNGTNVSSSSKLKGILAKDSLDNYVAI